MYCPPKFVKSLVHAVYAVVSVDLSTLSADGADTNNTVLGRLT